MNIVFYSNQKKTNSTAQPVASSSYPAVTKTCTLKEPTDVLRPVFQLGLDATTQNPWYNYIEWNETTNLKRFYFITGRTYLSDNMVEIACEIDVLATYKAFIVGETHFVARSASNHSAFITDTLYPTTQDKAVDLQSFSVGDYTDGFYVIGVIQQIGPGTAGNGYSFSRGSVYYYTAKGSEFETLLQFLTSPGAAYTDYDPLSHIVSCVYIPDDETGSSVTSQMFVHGGDVFNWTHTQISVSAEGLHSVPISSITLPNHPQYDGIRSYLNFPPFSKYMLMSPVFGEFEIDRSLLGSLVTPAVTLSLSVDCATGLASLIVSGGSQRLIQTSGMFGINILLAQQTTRGAADMIKLDNMATAVSLGGLASLTGAAVKKDIGGIAGTAINAITASNDYALASYLTSIPKVSVMSSNGAMSILSKVWVLQGEFAKVIDDDNLEFGQPLMDYRSLTGLVGYTQCMGARYSDYCSTKEERDAIDAFLNSGFFIQ